MRRFLSTLLGCLALAGSGQALLAQQPTTAYATPVVFLNQGCGPQCGGCPTCKVCVPEPTIKKHPHTVFGVKCVDYCLKKCPPFASLRGGCCNDGCGAACGDCGKPRTKKVLLKKVITCDEPDYKCRVEERPVSCQPACTNGCRTGRCAAPCTTVVVPAPGTPPAKMPPASLAIPSSGAPAVATPSPSITTAAPGSAPAVPVTLAPLP
jgi:hypothetical protein